MRKILVAVLLTLLLVTNTITLIGYLDTRNQLETASQELRITQTESATLWQVWQAEVTDLQEERDGWMEKYIELERNLSK